MLISLTRGGESPPIKRHGGNVAWIRNDRGITGDYWNVARKCIRTVFTCREKDTKTFSFEKHSRRKKKKKRKRELILSQKAASLFLKCRVLRTLLRIVSRRESLFLSPKKKNVVQRSVGSVQQAQTLVDATYHHRVAATRNIETLSMQEDRPHRRVTPPETTCITWTTVTLSTFSSTLFDNLTSSASRSQHKSSY